MKCYKCGLDKNAKYFSKDKHRKRGKAVWCKACKSNWTKTHHAKHPEKYWKSFKFHKISNERYAEMLASQGGVCAICQKPPTENRRLAVDHDHACCPYKQRSCGKCIRGLLCSRCNTALGLAHDEPLILRSMIEYLERANLVSTGSRHPA